MYYYYYYYFGEIKIYIKYNFVQYVFFEKGIRSVQCGLGQSHRSWGMFENFCVKSSLIQSVRLLLTVSYRKKMEEQLLHLLRRFRSITFFHRLNSIFAKLPPSTAIISDKMLSKPGHLLAFIILLANC